MLMTTDLHQKHCTACEGIGVSLSVEQIDMLLPQLDAAWKVMDEKMLARRFSFADFHETMAFVNAIAWIAHQENHHPDLTMGYNYCQVHFTTHALNGLSHNDFICASKIDHLVKN